MISKIHTSLFEKPRQRLPTILVKRADQWWSIPQSDFLCKDRSQKEVLWKHPFCLLFHVLAVSISGSFLGPQVHSQDPEQLESSCWGPGGMARRHLSAPSGLVPSAFPHCHLWTWSPWVSNSMQGKQAILGAQRSRPALPLLPPLAILSHGYQTPTGQSPGEI